MASRDRQLRLNDLPISHVLTCSPCFKDYARLRHRLVFVRSVQVTAACLALLAVMLVAVRFVRNQPPGRGEPSLSHNRVEPHRDGTQHAPRTVAPLAMTINLASYSPTRGDEAKASAHRIHLPPKSLRVTFLLPVGLEPGEYAFRLEDLTGAAIKETRATAQLSNGIATLEVDLDLTLASRGKFNLMIRPPGLSWRTFPVSVD